MLDACAVSDYGRNVLAHALAQLQRDGWLRETPEPLAPCEDAPGEIGVPE